MTGATSTVFSTGTAPGLSTLTLDQMEIDGNSAQVLNFGYSENLTVTNSTIANNQTGSGPAISLYFTRQRNICE